MLKLCVIVLFRKKCTNMIHRGTIIGVNVLSNMLNELMEGGKMRGLSSILTLFRNEFNKFNNTEARMLNSICHMALKLLKIAFSGIKRSRYCHFYATLKWTSLHTLLKRLIDFIALRYITPWIRFKIAWI